MKILVNGYFYGGNCPPFVYQLKKFNQDTKLTNSLNFLDCNGINTDYISENDIIDIKLNYIEKLTIRFLKRIKINLWKLILIKKYKELVDKYKPDLILNHKASEKAEIMLKTGFRPQYTYLYGGEVHGNRVFDKSLDYVFENSDIILTTTIELFKHVYVNRPKSQIKLKHFPISPFEYSKIQSYKKQYSKEEIRKKYGLQLTDKIFVDSRSLRSNNSGILTILESIKNLSIDGFKFKMIFLRGHLGTDKLVNLVNQFVDENPNIGDSIFIVDKIVSNNEIWDYYYLSDAFISLLPHDQFGSSIIDAIFLDCKLILSDIEAYHNELGKDAFYVKSQNEIQLYEFMKQIILDGSENKNENTLNNLLQKYSAENNYYDLYQFISNNLKTQ